MIKYSQHSLRLPFVMAGLTDTFYFANNMVRNMIDVSGIKSTLPEVSHLILGWVDGEQIAVIYSPTILGRKLDDDNIQDIHWALHVALNQLNHTYQKDHKTTDIISATHFIDMWSDVCIDWKLNPQDVYDQWAALEQKQRLNNYIEKHRLQLDTSGFSKKI